MKKFLLLLILLITTAQTIQSQTVVLDNNGVTVKWTGTTVPTPYFVQANPRGTGMEWFAIVNNSTKSNITDYAKNIQSGIDYFTRPTTTTPIPFNNIVTTLMTDMSNMFERATAFNQPIGSWDVSNVSNMSSMFIWTLNGFNQDISNWNVSNVLTLRNTFLDARAFNQDISRWNISRVTDMNSTFTGASAFNQPIGNWNVSNVTDMSRLFAGASSFNQNIGSWNVSRVTDMWKMFLNASNFNQPLGSWNVSRVTIMTDMFLGTPLSTANYDALLIGWSTISPNETALRPNVVFSGGNSKYCNGTTARSAIISTYGWTITDGGPDANCVLDTDEFERNSLKLYPNPVVSVLNIKTDNHLINQPYTIIDGLGRIVLNGKLNEVDTTINVEQLSKGIYYLKVSGNSSTKFIKE
jgi:surface protein